MANIGIVGFGYVGQATARFFSRQHYVRIYDKYLSPYSDEITKSAINNCDLAFVTVPTPTASDGWSCDLSELFEVLTWLNVPTCIKSTIPPGTIDGLTNSRSCIVYCPEYIGEGVGHRWTELDASGFVILGGDKEATERVAQFYRSVGPDLNIAHTSAKTAELCKYMENAFLATKVTFVNQFYDIASLFNVDFEELINLWTLDERVGTSHCRVTPERGFGGKCLPKDLRAIIASVQGAVDMQFLTAVLTYNDRIRACEGQKVPPK
jgi:UDPglucose 6-dehydrogenase